MITIPETVLTKIVEHRPHLVTLAENLRGNPSLAVQIEKALANAYLNGETRLSAAETWSLSYCVRGEIYGGGTR